MTASLSLLNFRDVGGLPASDGTIRPGLLYRSEGPASFGSVHREELRALGIRLVCDLRADSEREKDPNDWCDTVRLMNVEVSADLKVRASDGWMALRHDPTVEGVRRAVAGNYAAMPEAIRPHLHALVAAITAGETPALVHCTAGKDRTGVLVALLLQALEVPHAAIVADYKRSDVFARNLRMRDDLLETFETHFGFRPSESVVDATIDIDVAALEGALALVDQEYGSIRGYLAAAAIDDELLERFRATMVTRTPTTR